MDKSSWDDDAHAAAEQIAAAFEAMHEHVQDAMRELLAQGRVAMYEAVARNAEFIKDCLEHIAAQVVAEQLIRRQPEDQA